MNVVLWLQVNLKLQRMDLQGCQCLEEPVSQDHQQNLVLSQGEAISSQLTVSLA